MEILQEPIEYSPGELAERAGRISAVNGELIERADAEIQKTEAAMRATETDVARAWRRLKWLGLPLM